MNLGPGDPTLWTGVIFVRSGPYASAILRFQIRFPSSYPDLPPLVTFSTDVFHPLIVPLTTYTFSTGSGGEDPVSATDEGRLPPGGFSLRHGFPHWFSRKGRRDGGKSTDSRDASRSATGIDTPRGRSTVLSDERAGTVPNDNQNASGSTTESSSTTQPPRDDATETDKEASLVPGHPISTVPVVALLDYIRSTFDDATVLDSVPLAAAGNPSAWHAWKAHRRGSSSTFGRNSRRGSPQTRLPGDWHWDGIWAKRAKDEIEASHSEATLFGSSSRTAGDEMIRFSRLDDAAVETVKEMVVQYMEDVRW
ncbi:hypothetical protein MAP00_002596 [Monascus purpureus]|nr:hypothetical protein MAP00_002596 [Monascus purpureus]